jgi:hypothetical protein
MGLFIGIPKSCGEKLIYFGLWVVAYSSYFIENIKESLYGKRTN